MIEKTLSTFEGGGGGWPGKVSKKAKRAVGLEPALKSQFIRRPDRESSQGRHLQNTTFIWRTCMIVLFCAAFCCAGHPDRERDEIARLPSSSTSVCTQMLRKGEPAWAVVFPRALVPCSNDHPLFEICECARPTPWDDLPLANRLVLSIFAERTVTSEHNLSFSYEDED
ncbi:1076_t:CDS:1 [Acaulospora colombiana]|uniref:1076_t:CDS:1 n=1 Tax=Acaulospora colombiana TaxID=27376 RepID=A0ACA9MYH7_9GLOM|nr:1076_t:CDS:1 [Acaulospora colombiana]